MSRVIVSSNDSDKRSAAVPARRRSEVCRIAYVICQFDIGGLERCAARLINHLDRDQYQPLIICLDRNGDAAPWIEADDVPIVELNKKPGNDPRVVWRLAKVLKKFKVELVQSHNWGTLVETVMARRLAGVAFHLHVEHGQELADLRAANWRRRLRGIVTRKALATADAVVAVTDSVRERLVGRSGFPVEKIEIVPNGVELLPGGGANKDPASLRDSLGISTESAVIGSVGRLAPVKNFSAAIDALSRLVERGLDIHLVLVGDGPLRNELERQVGRQKIASRVHLVGQQVHVGDWLAMMDIYVNSSLSEGMSLSIMEAMAAGCPSVVTDVGGNAGLILGDDACGLVVPAADSEALATGIERLWRDSYRRGQMASHAFARYQKRFSTLTMVGNYQQIYGRLLGST
jgi:sugar transferase (PEP-CTERM/EpsH1 system associated)